MKQLLALTFSFLLAVVSFPVSATNARGVSQKVRHAISGRITDPNGALVAGARITITGRSSHTTVVKTTNAKGQYDADLYPDTYDVVAAASGFKTATRTSTVLHGSRSYLDFVLNVGATGSPIVIPTIGTVKSGSGKTFEVSWDQYSSHNVYVNWAGSTNIGTASTAEEAMTKAETWLHNK